MESNKADLSPANTAPAQLAGYIYQVQRAALRLFELQEGETLGIEVLDDIHVERAGAATELLQVKHQSATSAIKDQTLTDHSIHLWKTLGIWADLIRTGT